MSFFFNCMVWNTYYSLNAYWMRNDIWAASWQNQQNGICAQRRLRSAWASAQSDQSSLSAWWSLVLSYPLSAQRRLWSDWADGQADLRLRWDGHTGHFVGFVMWWLLYSLNDNWMRNDILLVFYLSGVFRELEAIGRPRWEVFQWLFIWKVLRNWTQRMPTGSKICE